jgi:(1->4)-alpha-D-glucan 1-alpha-D-glucosylmutase
MMLTSDHSRDHRRHIPSSTYRVQLNSSFTFQHAADLVEYLGGLGIGTCYVSPVLTARSGSPHGYDVIDHSRLNPDVGTDEQFCEFALRLRDRGMGLLLDVVPNHMCVDSGNAWWWDVLENGPGSPYAQYFDIDWNPPKEELAGKVLLPVLGDQYGRVLESQGLQIVYESGAFWATLGETRLPLAPQSWPLILEPALAQLRQLGSGEPHVLELESILTALSYLPRGTETGEAKIRERQREKGIIERRLSELTQADSVVLAAVQESVRNLNGHQGCPRSFDRLEQLLAEQAYRLSYWRVAADEINYRRFFDVNDLACIRVEDPAVFSAVHERILDLVRKGFVTGLRVDHPDGLLDPGKYFQDLQNACCSAQPRNNRFFIVAEKIVIGDEELRPWDIDGTTGYGYLNFLNGLFVDSSRRQAFERLYQDFTGWSQSYDDLIYESKKLILQVSMSSELNVLARRLDRISEHHRWFRDFTLENLRDALREVITCFPIYRTYVRTASSGVDAEDERHIRAAIQTAKRRNPAMSESVFDFIQGVLLLEDPAGLSDEQRAERRLFVMRLQQFTGPVMAKGVEDTAFYRYFPLGSLNEVGGEPRVFGGSPSFFHAKSSIRLALWPGALLATSTHDSKRSEDVRARINVLSEVPESWSRAIRSWQQLNRHRKTVLGGAEVPHANEEYLLYQTLIGTWPSNPMSAEEYEHYCYRIQGYLEKAVREAKIHTSWVNPNIAYESAVRGFVAAILDPAPGNRFLAEFRRFQEPVGRAGIANSLSQVLIKVASPGVPDFYQGTEIWNYSLVDPDNRRPVDFALRRALLQQLDEEERHHGTAILAQHLFENPADGRVKLFVTSRALRFRRARQSLFAQGDYIPLRATGVRRRHVLAFARNLQEHTVIAVAGRFFVALNKLGALPLGRDVWGDSALLLRRRLPSGRYRDILTDTAVETVLVGGRALLPLADVFSRLPVALLINDSG